MPGRVCPWWLAYSFDNPVRRLFHNPRKILSPYLQTGMTALDVGAGMGYFSIGMAKLVGEPGRVIAVDLQAKMLEILERRAKRAGVADRIRTRLCSSDRLGIEEPVDFVLTFWMVHEVRDRSRLMTQIRTCLKPGGRYLLVEPSGHVPLHRFQAEIESASAAGFRLDDRPRVGLSRAALFI